MREPVPITLVVENRSDHAVDLILRGRTPTFDVFVMESSGEVVWQRLKDEIIPAIVHVRRLSAHDGFEMPAAWDQAITAGTYFVRGELLLEDSKLSTQTLRLEIED